MQKNADIPYAKLAPYYRPMLEKRDHFAKQLKLLNVFLSRYGTSRTARILDAACGTGDVVTGLHTMGYSQVAGVDASEDMLAQAQALQGVADVPLQKCRWQELDRYLGSYGNYDVIFILGHALPHAEKEEIPAIVRNVYNGLNPGGIFVFDIRMWTRVQDGSLVQPGRQIGIFRWLGKFRSGKHCYWVDDCCEYESGRQYITYRFRRINDGGLGWDHEERLVLSYTPFEPEEALRWLQDAGFRQIEVQQPDPKKWPYMLVVGEKGREVPNCG